MERKHVGRKEKIRASWTTLRTLVFTVSEVGGLRAGEGVGSQHCHSSCSVEKGTRRAERDNPGTAGAIVRFRVHCAFYGRRIN